MPAGLASFLDKKAQDFVLYRFLDLATCPFDYRKGRNVKTDFEVLRF